MNGFSAGSPALRTSFCHCGIRSPFSIPQLTNRMRFTSGSCSI